MGNWNFFGFSQFLTCFRDKHFPLKLAFLGFFY